MIYCSLCIRGWGEVVMRILSCFWFCFAFGFFSGRGQTSFDDGGGGGG